MAKTAKTMMSPRGVAVFPRLNEPDVKFDELGIYKADIAVPLEEAKPLMDQLQEIHKSHTGKAAPSSKNSMFEMETDRDSGDETGRVVFKFRVKNRMTKQGKLWDRQPTIFDAKGQRIMDIPSIGGGSVLKVFFEVYEWTAGVKMGVSLQPAKVQLIELHEYGGDSFSPFDEEEGFTVETQSFEEEETTSDGEDF